MSPELRKSVIVNRKCGYEKLLGVVILGVGVGGSPPPELFLAKIAIFHIFHLILTLHDRKKSGVGLLDYRGPCGQLTSDSDSRQVWRSSVYDSVCSVFAFNGFLNRAKSKKFRPQYLGQSTTYGHATQVTYRGRDPLPPDTDSCAILLPVPPGGAVNFF